MATYVPAKRATAWIGYIALVSQADTKLLKSNPTIAAGDFKVSKDGGALANLTTLPAVTPASSVMVKIDLSATEMTADNVTVVCIDAAGAEWCDLAFNLQTAARQIDDLAYPATSGRSMVVDAAGLVDANAVKVGPTGSGTAQTAGDIIGDTNDIQGRLPAALVSGRIDASVGAMAANVMTAAAAAADLTTELQSGLATQASVDTIDDFLDTEIAAIKAKTDQLTFTVANEVNANARYINGDATAAANLAKSTKAIFTGTCDAGSSATSIVAAALTPASAVNDQPNGRIMIFNSDTSTAALRNQATDITDFVHATQTFTVTALTTAPSSGDTFIIV